MQKFYRRLMALLVCLLVIFSLAVTTYAVTLNCWHSDSDEIFRWKSAPTIYYNNLSVNSNFTLSDWLVSGRNQWLNVTGFYAPISSTNAGASIRYWGGTPTQIEATGLFSAVPTKRSGITYASSVTYDESQSYNGVTRNIGTAHLIIGYIVDRSEYSPANCKKTTIHELGHAMGWWGHPDPYNSAYNLCVMRQGTSTYVTLQPVEKNHLSQVYN